MVNIGYEHLFFLFTVHALLTYGANEGLIGEEQAGQSQKFVQEVQGDKLINSTNIEQGGIAKQISLSIKAVPVIGDIYDLLSTPYGLMINSNLPGIIKTLMLGFFSITELAILVKLIRGVDL